MKRYFIAPLIGLAGLAPSSATADDVVIRLDLIAIPAEREFAYQLDEAAYGHSVTRTLITNVQCGAFITGAGRGRSHLAALSPDPSLFTDPTLRLDWWRAANRSGGQSSRHGGS